MTRNHLRTIGVSVLSLGLAGLLASAPSLSARAAAAGPGVPPNGQVRQDARGAKPQNTPPGIARLEWEWWNDPDVKRDLKLSDERAKAIQDVYEVRLREAQPWVDDYLRQREKLDKMTKDRSATEAVYSLQVSRVEALRSRLFESRLVMLYRMSLELTSDQYKQLQDIREQRMHSNDNRGRGTPPVR